METELLERLAAEVRKHGLSARLDFRLSAPALRVVNPAARIFADWIGCHDGHFWWSWQIAIAPVSDVRLAAASIAAVMATPQCHDQQPITAV
jgi:hypothetical protein